MLFFVLAACSTDPDVALVRRYVTSCTTLGSSCQAGLRKPPSTDALPVAVTFDPDSACRSFRKESGRVFAECTHLTVHTQTDATYVFTVEDGTIVSIEEKEATTTVDTREAAPAARSE